VLEWNASSASGTFVQQPCSNVKGSLRRTAADGSLNMAMSQRRQTPSFKHLRPISEVSSRTKKAVRSQDTKPEIILRRRSSATGSPVASPKMYRADSSA
jgi:hypothetical protein